MSKAVGSDQKTEQLDTKHHPRTSPYGRFIYPVLSRRSGGLSLGINLNPDKKCNFGCVYCQVTGRDLPLEKIQPDCAEILADLERFITTPNPLSEHPIQDFAIAGDGEPTQSKILPEVIAGLVELKKKHQLQYGLEKTKIILFTNGAGLRLPRLEPALDALTQAGGEIWYKLDFWNEESFQRINRPEVHYETILANLVAAGKKYPLVLQSCFFSDRLNKTKKEWLDLYILLVQNLLKSGVQVYKIQAYTLARSPAETWAQPYTKEEMDKIAGSLQKQLPKEITVELYYDH